MSSTVVAPLNTGDATWWMVGVLVAIGAMALGLIALEIKVR